MNMESPNEGGIEREISPEIIKALEGLNIKAPDKALIILLAVGLKPAAEFTAETKVESSDSRFPGKAESRVPNDEEDLENIRKTLSALKVTFLEKPLSLNLDSTERDDRTGETWKDRLLVEGIEFYCGDKAEELEKKFSDPLGSRDHDAIGELLGIPKSARSNLLSEDVHSPPHFDKMSKEILMDEGMAFLFFYPSLSNLEEELEIGRRRSEVVKKISPVIWVATVEDRREDFRSAGWL